MSVIVSRALPDVRDGLKPVQRRILYAMHKLGMVYSQKHKKSATVVGEVLGKYHPHGDQAIYDSLVRMAQEFSLRNVLVDGQGNFGSIDGDNAAAMRYTECRLAKISAEMLQNIEKETVDYQDNFDDTLKEPVVLPSAIPNLLINGASGIAVGMATNIPSHNLKEVVDAICYYIENRESCTIADLLKFIKGPDFCTGGTIYSSNLENIYSSGRGSIKIRGKVTLDKDERDRDRIIVDEIPYQVNKAEMIKKIAQAVKEERIKGISDIRDESDKDGIRVVVELKRDAHVQTTLNQIYKHSTLEVTFGYNLISLVNKAPRLLNLHEMVVYFVAHRFEVITRRIKFDLNKAEKRAHIVEGLIKACNNIDEVVRIIRASKTVEEAKKDLMSTFDFTTVQAQAILDMRLARLVALEMQKLKEEFDHLQKLIAEYKDLLAHPEKIYSQIKDDLKIIAETYGNDRKTEIIKANLEGLEEEDYIQKSNMVVSLTKTGYIKRVPIETYREQNRGGTGVKGVGVKDENDIVSMLLVTTTHEYIMFISNKGKAYYLKTYQIPQSSRNAKGQHIKMLLNLENDEHIQGYLTFSNFEEEKSFAVVTRDGVIKRSRIQDFSRAKIKGIIAVKLRDNDSVVSVVDIDSEEDDIMIYSRLGLAVRTKASNIRVMGRAASGVRGMRLRSEDEIVGMVKVDADKNMLVLSQRGMGKKLAFSEFSNKGRGGKGQIFMKIDDKTGEIAAVTSVSDDQGILISTSKGNIIRIHAGDISLLGRQAKGPRLIRLKEPDMVINIAPISEIEEDGTKPSDYAEVEDVTSDDGENV